jgi:hypothetical protein
LSDDALAPPRRRLELDGDRTPRFGQKPLSSRKALPRDVPSAGRDEHGTSLGRAARRNANFDGLSWVGAAS